jgi:hypothetical protein
LGWRAFKKLKYIFWCNFILLTAINNAVNAIVFWEVEYRSGKVYSKDMV